MVKTILLTVSGALVASFLLAFISDRAGLGNAFGGGLGGECGEAVVGWSCNLFGKILTGLILLALLAMWLFFASKKFNRWMSGIGAAETADEPDNARADGGSDKVKPLLDRKADGKVLTGEDNAARSTSSVAERSEPSERPIPPRPQPTPVAAPVVSPLTAPKDATAVDKPLEVIKDDSLTTEVKKELSSGSVPESETTAKAFICRQL